jgi:hypothetical protein
MKQPIAGEDAVAELHTRPARAEREWRLVSKTSDRDPAEDVANNVVRSTLRR